MRRHQNTLAAKNGGENVLTIIGERAGDGVLETFPAGRLDVVTAPPFVNLLLAPFLARIVLVEADEIAVVALVERLIAAFGQAGQAQFGEGQIERMLGADQRRG